MDADWQSSWENALFADDARLREFAQAHARELEITARAEIDGRIQSRIRLPQGGTMSVQLSLARLSLRDWESCLLRLEQEAPEIGHSLLARPALSLHAFLSRLGWPLFPQGLRDVRLVAAPPSPQEPCPYCMGVLVAVGRMMAADPWVLLRLRGLAPEDVRRWLQRQGDGGSQGVRPAGPRPPSDPGLISLPDMAHARAGPAAEAPSASFWGDARALRAFRPRIVLNAASAPPKVTLGAPPVEDADEKRSLADLVAHLYEPGPRPPLETDSERGLQEVDRRRRNRR